MKLSTFLAVLPAVLAGPAQRSELAPLLSPPGAEHVEDKYIVKFKDDVAHIMTSDTAISAPYGRGRPRLQGGI